MRIRQWFDLVWHNALGRPYRLHYQTYGSGDKPLLLIHGLASSHKVWQPLISEVGGDWNIIAPDLLGFGSSPTPLWGEYDVAQHTKHILAVVRRLGVREPVTIVGHSMGCLIATHIAAQHPELVERLVLYEPPLFADVPNYRAHARARARYFALFRYIAAHPELAFKNGELRRLFAGISGISLSPGTWVPFERSLKNTIMSQHAYNELHDIAVPTVIAQGRLDLVVPRADVRKMLSDNQYITFMTVNRIHGVSRRAARELAKLLRG